MIDFKNATKIAKGSKNAVDNGNTFTPTIRRDSRSIHFAQPIAVMGYPKKVYWYQSGNTYFVTDRSKGDVYGYSTNSLSMALPAIIKDAVFTQLGEDVQRASVKFHYKKEYNAFYFDVKEDVEAVK